jgi:ribosome-binding protein aMBF1 (putative translation factor)
MNTMIKKRQTKLGLYLRNRGISQTWLAKKLKVEPVTVHRYCWGEVDLTLNKINEIAQILEVPNALIS